MIVIARKLFRRVVPFAIRRQLWEHFIFLKTNFGIGKAKIRFFFSGTQPDTLSSEWLQIYYQKYPGVPYSFDLSTRQTKAKERARNILELLPNKNVCSFLELGCGDGLLCHYLRKNGYKTVSIDLEPSGFEKEAIDSGVHFSQMDASKLGIRDGAFDAVVSYDAFEHFPDPEKALQEAIRVVKPGGFLFFEFGPLFMSPMGGHLALEIGIPYCRLLFRNEDILQFSESMELGDLKLNQVNRYSASDFRKIWRQNSDNLERVYYHEIFNILYLDMLAKHPSCFKSKTNDFEDLMVSGMRVVFQKKTNV